MLSVLFAIAVNIYTIWKYKLTRHLWHYIVVHCRDDWMKCNRKLSEKVCAIIQSDLHKTNPLVGTGLEDTRFDAISLPLSQNSASSTVAQYEQSVRNYRYLPYTSCIEQIKQKSVLFFMHILSIWDYAYSIYVSHV